MKIRSIDLPRRITLPDGRTFEVTPDGFDVPADLEREVRKVVDLNEHIVIADVREPEKMAPATGHAASTPGPDKSAKP
ncbi:MAG: hypothetical protein M3547_00125 [Acidobacteriota bacterium]|nr:hypothetical protein [Acidobacteriota bacterium]